MADKLIYELTDTQESYDKDLYLAVDDSSFTNTKKIKIGTIYPKIDDLSAAGDFNPATSTLRLGNGSGSESKVTVNDLLSDTDVINTIKLLGSTGWKTYVGGDVTKNLAAIDANTFIVNVISVLGFVTITGRLNITSSYNIDDVLFTLPASIPTATANIYFGAVDSDYGSADENIEMYLPANTRTVKAHSDGSINSLCVFSVTFPAI